jgi:hypothetical protein
LVACTHSSQLVAYDDAAEIFDALEIIEQSAANDPNVAYRLRDEEVPEQIPTDILMSILANSGEGLDTKETQKLHEFADLEQEGVVRNSELIDKLIQGRAHRIKVGKKFIQ